MNTGDVSEESSDIQPKRKPGRPKVVSDEESAMLNGLGNYQGIESRRGRIDFSYRLDAMRALKDDPARFGWLYDEGVIKAGDESAWKPSILTELGRLGDPDRIRGVADRICELKPKARDAIAMIRRFRIGRDAPSSALGLADVIADAINRYTAHRHDLADPVGLILESLDLVRSRLERR